MKKILTLMIAAILLAGCINVTIEVPEEKMSKVVDKVVAQKDDEVIESISQEGANENFQVKPGTPPGTPQDELIYKNPDNNVQLKGWIVDRSTYVGPPIIPHFFISEESKKHFPSYRFDDPDKDEFLRAFILNNEKTGEMISNDTIKELRKYSKEVPATILVSGYQQYLEGTASMDFVKILE